MCLNIYVFKIIIFRFPHFSLPNYTITELFHTPRWYFIYFSCQHAYHHSAVLRAAFLINITSQFRILAMTPVHADVRGRERTGED